MRASNADADRLVDAVLAPDGGPEKRRYAVIASEIQDAVVWVRVQSLTHQEPLWLYMLKPDKRMLRNALADGLAGLPAETLAHRFPERVLDPLPAVSDDDQRYNKAQRRALAACCSPGLQAVWGPPGTGKTYVIVGAIDRLIREGRRVLLVSNTNIAVDNAVEGVLDRLQPTSGRVVRVGTPHIPNVARDPRVALPALVERRQRADQERIAALELQIIEIERAGPRDRLNAATAALAGFDLREYRAAAKRRDNRQVLAELDREFASARNADEAASETRDTCRARVLAAQLLYALADEHQAAQRAERIRQDLAEAKDQGWVNRLAGMPATVRTRRLLTEAEAAALSAVNARAAAETALRSAGYRLPDAYAVVGTTSLQAARARLDTAITAEHASAGEARATAARLQTSAQRREAAARAPQPTAQDLALLDRADELGLPAIQEQLPALHRAVAEIDGALRRLRDDHEKLVKKVGETRFGIERDIIANANVVATTLAMLTLKKVITDQPFDHVIVDEAAAACLPDVAHAVGYARTGAVMLGDYLQNGPIVDPDIKKDEHLNRLYRFDCFTNFRLTDPLEAQQNPGCVVMTEQRRFGEKLTRLANLVAYRDRLSAVEPKPCDIVLIDTDGLGSALNTIRRPSGGHAGTWPIGSLVSRALAEHHHGRDGKIGVVVPYNAQAKATHDLLAESPCGPDIEVGTAHTFQGRECDVVIFDLVEDGRGWMAQASLSGDPYALGGLRVFNVATTRARHRLYLIADGAAIQRARSGPLQAVRTMIDEGAIERIRASDVLGLDDHDAPPEGTAHHDIWTALQPYVRLVGIYDEKMVLDTVQQRIDSATGSVWMWSPWVGRHSIALQDSLVQAADRGLKVRVMALPETEINAKLRESLAELRRRIPHTLLVHNMHQKIVVVDDRWTFVGSMNLLSHARRPADRRHEIMIQVESPRFAQEILSFELAQQLRQLQRCAKCGQPMCEVVEAGRNPGRRWYWLCGNDINGMRCAERLPLPDRVGRNQP